MSELEQHTKTRGFHNDMREFVLSTGECEFQLDDLEVSGNGDFILRLQPQPELLLRGGQIEGIDSMRLMAGVDHKKNAEQASTECRSQVFGELLNSLGRAMQWFGIPRMNQLQFAVVIIPRLACADSIFLTFLTFSVVIVEGYS